MSDIEKFITARKARNPKAWADFDTKYRRYAIGMLLARHRQKAGLSVSQFVKLTKMKKEALSRLENHGIDVRLSTISRYVQATGKPFELRFNPIVPRKTSGGQRQQTRMASTVELISA
jgi:transcriptional regulator with XRE-family HTH domain